MLGRLYDFFQNISDRSKVGGTIGSVIFTRLLNLQFGVLIPMYAMLIFSVDLMRSAARHLPTDPEFYPCLLYTSPSPRDGATSRMPSSA